MDRTTKQKIAKLEHELATVSEQRNLWSAMRDQWVTQHSITEAKLKFEHERAELWKCKYEALDSESRVTFFLLLAASIAMGILSLYLGLHR